jgi:hypothetical protein
MLAEDGSEFHHVNGFFRAENFGKGIVGTDEPFVLGILEFMGFGSYS